MIVNPLKDNVVNKNAVKLELEMGCFKKNDTKWYDIEQFFSTRVLLTGAKSSILRARAL